MKYTATKAKTMASTQLITTRVTSDASFHHVQFIFFVM